MSDSVRVLSVTTLDDLNLALAEFTDRTQSALDLIDGEILRVKQWLEQQAQQWRAEARRAEEEVFLAQQALARKRLRQDPDARVDTTEEERALLRAKRKLEFVEEKAEATRRWLAQLDHELVDYEGPSRTLKSLLEHDVPNARALLARKVEVLLAYMESPDVMDAAPIGESNATESAKEESA